MTFPSFFRLVSVLFIGHVYSFQSSCTLSGTSHGARSRVRTDGFQSSRSIDALFPLHVSSSEDSKSLPKRSHAERWETMFNLLSAYKEREGHTNVPQQHKEDKETLGVWLSKQRQMRKTGKLLPERKEKLESLGVGWEIVSRPGWDAMFHLLSAYKEREGHTNVPWKHKEKGNTLGEWLSRQRQMRKTGKLPPERKDKLESLGVGWEIISHSTTSWGEMFHLLSAYKEREGNVSVPSRHKENGENLGAWLSKQRYMRKTGKLLPERKEKLESLGVEWAIKSRPSWDEMFHLLSAYKEREGNISVPSRHIENGENLGIWLISQRRGKLLPERQSKLDSLSVEWDEKRLEMQWDRMFGLLCIYGEREGHTNVPKSHKEDGENLGKWLATQRHAYIDGTLLAEREKRLDSLGAGLDGDHVHQSRLDMRWETWFHLLCTYNEREGHANVPKSHKEDGENLGRWLSWQRSLYKAGKLKAEREIKLNSLGVRLETKRYSKGNETEFDRRWESMFVLLCKYKKREGNAHVPQSHKEDGKNLGQWLSKQLQKHNEWALREDRKSKLESLGVVWDNIPVNLRRLELQWEQNLDLLCTYKEREGHANVPTAHKEGGENLGHWLKWQRRLYNAGKLKTERQRKLEALGVRWTVR